MEGEKSAKQERWFSLGGNPPCSVMENTALKPQYFDLTVMDVEVARRFFEACLGWQFVPFEPIPGYYRIQAGAAEEPGVDGGIGAAKDFPQSEGRPLTLMTIPVPDVDDVVAKVEQNGGRVVEPKRAILELVGSARALSPEGCCLVSFKPTRPQSERAYSESVGYLSV